MRCNVNLSLKKFEEKKSIYGETDLQKIRSTIIREFINSHISELLLNNIIGRPLISINGDE